MSDFLKESGRLNIYIQQNVKLFYKYEISRLPTCDFREQRFLCIFEIPDSLKNKVPSVDQMSHGRDE